MTIACSKSRSLSEQQIPSYGYNNRIINVNDDNNNHLCGYLQVQTWMGRLSNIGVKSGWLPVFKKNCGKLSRTLGQLKGTGREKRTERPAAGTDVSKKPRGVFIGSVLSSTILSSFCLL